MPLPDAKLFGGATQSILSTRATNSSCITGVIKILKKDFSGDMLKLWFGFGRDNYEFATVLIDLHFRLAQSADAEFFFTLRNDPITRAMSRNNQKIDWTEHKQWFLSQIDDPDHELFLARYNKKYDIGTVRVDSRNAVSELSWTIAPEWRGSGFGKALLKQFIEFRPGDYLAVIRSDNFASCKMCENAGFNRHRTESNYSHYINYSV